MIFLKYFTYYIFLILSLNACYSQTYIVPKVGYDAMISGEKSPILIGRGIKTSDQLLSVHGVQYGLDITQYLFRKIDGRLNLSFANREVGLISVINQNSSFKFNQFRTGIEFVYKFLDVIQVGLGFNINKWNALHFVTNDVRREIEYKQNPTETGGNIIVVSKLNNIEIKLYYHNSFAVTTPIEIEYFKLQPTDYIGLSIGYRFKVLNSFN